MLLNNILGLLYQNGYHDMIKSLVAALEAKDYYTCGHSKRVAFMVCELSKKLGVKGRKFEDIHIAAHLHDKCINEIRAKREIMFDPLIVDCVLDNVFEFKKI